MKVWWIRLFQFALTHIGCGGGLCSNRWWKTFMAVKGNYEWIVILRNLDERDHYSREDLIVMLRTIRREEASSEWKVPEPTPEDLELSVAFVGVARYNDGKATR